MSISGSPISQTPRALALSRSEIDGWLGGIYPALLAGEPVDASLGRYCRRLGERLAAPLVRLLRLDRHGVLHTEAQSAESLLWSDLQLVPERTDEGLAGRGPASAALKAAAPVVVGVDDESLIVWRAALRREQIDQVFALPLTTLSEERVLEVFVRQSGAMLDETAVHLVAQTLARLIDDAQSLRCKNLLEAALESAGNAAFATDLEGTIVWSNAAFQRLSGYSSDEIIGSNPRFLKSGQQSLRYYRDLWSTIRSGRVWAGQTVDRDKRGESYIIHQTVSPVVDNDRVTHYVSIQTDVTRAQQRRETLERQVARDPVSGLLPRAAFDIAAEDALRAAHGRPFAFVVVSVPALRALPDSEAGLTDAGESAVAAQLRDALPASALACSAGSGDFLIFLRAPADGEPSWKQSMDRIASALNEPLPLLGEGLGKDLRIAFAESPGEGDSLTALRLSAERKLARDPLGRARRMVAARR